MTNLYRQLPVTRGERRPISDREWADAVHGDDEPLMAWVWIGVCVTALVAVASFAAGWMAHWAWRG